MARWENEGGSLDADWKKRVALVEGEDRILHCVGAAVIMHWNNLPTEVQQEIFAGAASLGDPLDAPQLKEQIARFLHAHKEI